MAAVLPSQVMEHSLLRYHERQRGEWQERHGILAHHEPTAPARTLKRWGPRAGQQQADEQPRGADVPSGT